jgi:hypothetical protein
VTSERNDPEVEVHISVFVRGSKAKEWKSFFAHSVELTPARMKLLAMLVDEDGWARSRPSRKASWSEIEAAVRKRPDAPN